MLYYQVYLEDFDDDFEEDFLMVIARPMMTLFGSLANSWKLMSYCNFTFQLKVWFLLSLDAIRVNLNIIQKSSY